MAFDYFKWSQKRYKKEGEILKKAFKRKLTDVEKIELLELSIYPYSRDGRFGMKKALKHAIKLLNNENRLLKQSKLKEEKRDQTACDYLEVFKELKEACKTHMGRMVYILQEDKFKLIEKELKRLEQLEVMYSNCVIACAKMKREFDSISKDYQEIKEIAKHYNWDDITSEIFNVKTDRKYRDLFNAAIINIQEDYRKARAFEALSKEEK